MQELLDSKNEIIQLRKDSKYNLGYKAGLEAFSTYNFEIEL